MTAVVHARRSENLNRAVCGVDLSLGNECAGDNAKAPAATCTGCAFGPIRKWFSGKPLTVIDSFVIPTLVQAQADKRWPKGASRKVHAALNKQAVAAKFSKVQERAHNDRESVRDGGPVLRGKLDDVMSDRRHWYKAKLSAHDFIHCMRFGSVSRTPEMVELADKLAPLCLDDDERAALATARGWAADFAPVAALIKYLDEMRPAPVFEMGGTLSPTVTETIKRAELDPTTVRFPEMINVECEELDPKTGKMRKVMKIKIVWPEGTKHRAVRFGGQTIKVGDGKRVAAGKLYMSGQCEACGHGIRNPYNWVPLLIDNKKGVPHSMWIGRDCAKNLFAVDMTGEAEYLNREAA